MKRYYSFIVPIVILGGCTGKCPDYKSSLEKNTDLRIDAINLNHLYYWQNDSTQLNDSLKWEVYSLLYQLKQDIETNNWSCTLRNTRRRSGKFKTDSEKVQYIVELLGQYIAQIPSLDKIKMIRYTEITNPSIKDDYLRVSLSIHTDKEVFLGEVKVGMGSRVYLEDKEDRVDSR